MNSDFAVSFSTRVIARYVDNGEILLDKSNAIHSQNMARIISRALSHETNAWIGRIAFGNGGTRIDAIGNVIHNPPNDGINDNTWESRLYNETYSEQIDETDAAFGTDTGSSDPNNTRPGGGADPSGDPVGGGVASQEIGTKSNVIVTVFLNEGEPSGQALFSTDIPTEDEQCFIFDEIGLFSPGKPAKATNGMTTVNVGNKNSNDTINLTPLSVLTFNVTVDGAAYSCELTVPASGSGLSGEITYGDFCEGVNSGTWITGGDAINTLAYVFITDKSEGTYPTISGKQSYGFLIFQSKTSGETSTINVECDPLTATDLMNVLTSGVCSNCNVTVIDGENAGVKNDAITPTNERERLLTHIIFDPILKSQDRAISIVYTITVSTKSTSGLVEVNGL